MRIGIDARFYSPRVGGGGIGRYVEELVKRLVELPSEHEFILYFKPENFDAFTTHNPRVTKRLVKAHWYGLREQLEMPMAFLRDKLDLVHVPHFNVPYFCPVPFIATIHDLILFEVPESAKATSLGPFFYKLKRFGLWLTIARIAKRAKRILTPSQATADSLVKQFPKAADRIVVTPEGADHIGLGRAHETHQPNFLYVGSSYPHKNLYYLLEAMEYVDEQLPNSKLTLVGKDDAWMKGLMRRSHAMEIPVIHAPFASDDELAKLYDQATAFIYPSLVEGFGLPPLEAMRRGTPVIASDIPCHREVLGHAAILVSPEEPELLAKEMIRLAKSQSVRSELSALGFKQAERYSWVNTAKKTLEVYNGWKNSCR